MEKKTTYHEQKDVENILRLREVLSTLPPFCRDYFRAIDTTTTTKTRISYAYDIRIFFQFLLDENPAFKDYKMTDFYQLMSWIRSRLWILRNIRNISRSTRLVTKPKQTANVGSNERSLPFGVFMHIITEGK